MGKIRVNQQTVIFIGYFILSQIFVAIITTTATKIFVDTIFDLKNYILLFIIFLISIFLAIFFIWLLSKKAVRIFGMDVKTLKAENQKGLTFLLMGYSPLNTKSVPDPLTLTKLQDELRKLGVDNVVKSAEEYKKICDKKERLALWNPWQQNLRSAWHHSKAGTLKAIYVLDRYNEQAKTKDEFIELKEYLQEALSEKVKIIRISQPEDDNKPFIALERSGTVIPSNYENYDYVYEGLRRGLEMIRKHEDIDGMIAKFKKKWESDDDFIDSMTCIDATAGQKTFSIAAAAITLNRKLSYSYVTNDGELRFYDTNLRLGSGQ